MYIENILESKKLLKQGIIAILENVCVLTELSMHVYI